jgi:hypothetical protein
VLIAVRLSLAQMLPACAQLLKVVKYETPERTTADGKLFPLPAGVQVYALIPFGLPLLNLVFGAACSYDVESCGNFSAVVAQLVERKTPVLISEKLEGTNFSVSQQILDCAINAC